ncbi:MAG TPA: glycosyltransferase family 2 protein [Bacillota bacterium]|nr:glycosyltransferase family 2 protein [Bacillota bacterium]HQB81099.1 glycosyltransferase family 2 protein [Bacillota bacterium]
MQQDNPALISVVIPFYNEADQVDRTMEATEEVLQAADLHYEIIAVDDGSKDLTWDRLAARSRLNQKIRAFRLSRNFGKEAAICAGLDKARGQAVIVMDGDLQHPPQYIPDMVRLWQEGYEVVEGVRTADGNCRGNRLASNLFYAIFKRMSGIQLKNASDFKLIDRKVVDCWKTLPEKDTFFRALSAWMGFKRVSLPFVVGERASGKSKWGLRKLLKLSISALTGFSSRPLLLISSMGTFFLLVFLGLSIQTLVMYFRGRAATGFTTVILLQLLIGSIILISLGLIGIYIDSLFREVKARPRYFISEIAEAANPAENMGHD